MGDRLHSLLLFLLAVNHGEGGRRARAKAVTEAGLQGVRLPRKVRAMLSRKKGSAQGERIVLIPTIVLIALPAPKLGERVVLSRQAGVPVPSADISSPATASSATPAPILMPQLPLVKRGSQRARVRERRRFLLMRLSVLSRFRRLHLPCGKEVKAKT